MRSRQWLDQLSLALIALSVVWHVSACAYFATSGLKADWSGTPQLWTLVAAVAPAVCFAGGMILVDARKRCQFGPVQWWALVALFLPVTVGSLLSFWIVRVLLAMSGH